MTKKKIIIVSIIASVLIIGAVLGITMWLVQHPSCVVTFDLGGGEMSDTEMDIRYNCEYELPTPKRNEYAFAGWYYGEEFVSSVGVWKYDVDLVLTAKWEIRDENGVVYRKADNGYYIENIKGIRSEKVFLPSTYNGKPILGIDSAIFDKLNGYVESGVVNELLLYIPVSVVGYDASQAQKCKIILYSGMENGFVFLEKEGYASLISYSGDFNNNVIVPDKFNGLPVKEIADEVFYGASEYTGYQDVNFFRILMPESVEHIGKNTFGNCAGIKVSLYYINDNEIKEIVDLARLYDWSLGANVESGNQGLIDVVSQIRPAFEWSIYTNATYYVRFDAVGGDVLVDGESVYDAYLKRNVSYILPTPTKEGYDFGGWYYGEMPVSTQGDGWKIFKHITLTARWIEKEG